MEQSQRECMNAQMSKKECETRRKWNKRTPTSDFFCILHLLLLQRTTTKNRNNSIICAFFVLHHFFSHLSIPRSKIIYRFSCLWNGVFVVFFSLLDCYFLCSQTEKHCKWTVSKVYHYEVFLRSFLICLSILFFGWFCQMSLEVFHTFESHFDT